MVPLSVMGESKYVVGVKPGDSGALIWCQVDNFTCSLLA